MGLRQFTRQMKGDGGRTDIQTDRQTEKKMDR